MGITKIDAEHIAEIGTTVHKRIWTKDELLARKETLEADLVKTNNLLEVLG